MSKSSRSARLINVHMIYALACVGACGRSPRVGTGAGSLPAATGRIELLQGELAIALPIPGAIEPNRADDLMAAPTSSRDETDVMLRDGEFRIAAVFRREWHACANDPAAAARWLADGTASSTYDLAPISGATFLVWLREPEQRGDLSSPGWIATCAGGAGLISAHIIVHGELARGKDLTMRLARSIAPGSSPMDFAARNVRIPACGKAISLAVPAGYGVSDDDGDDFVVHHFRSLADVPEISIYVGHAPHSFAPADAQEIELGSNARAQRWTDAKGVHLQRMEDDQGCVVHAFGIAAGGEESQLRQLLAFTLGAAPN
jgi:hypothetical protein